MSTREASDSLQKATRLASILGQRLIRTSDDAAVEQMIIRALVSAVDAQCGALALVVPQEGVLRIVATEGYPHAIVEHIRIGPGEGILGRVFSSGRPVLVGDEAALAASPQRRRYRTQSCVVVPLKIEGRVIGVAAVSDPRHRDRFERIDLRALRLLLPMASLALERQRLRTQVVTVSQAAIMDPVTGLANRVYLGTRLDAEIERSRRLGQPLALLLVDIDNFKRVNDTWGHLVGDRVLHEVAVLLAEHVRIFDVCTRYGGEEFAIVMPGADEAVAMQVAERVRRAADLAYGNARGGVRVTLSVGVALLGVHDTAVSLIDRADQAMLVAKADGKNAVRSAEHRQGTDVPS